MVTFRIETEISSPATHIMIARNTRTNQPACLKMWLPCDDDLYFTTDLKKCNDYFIEGLKFNRRFAPGVYQGLAKFITRNDAKHEVRYGRLIKKPRRSQLKDDCNYALVMNRLDDALSLDHQLNSEKIGNVRGMEFLAEAIAEMHKHLDPSTLYTTTDLSKKLRLNQQKFIKALHEVHTKAEFSQFRRRIGSKGWSRLISLGESLEQLAETYKHIFEHRYQAKKIRRCHGDLKVTNLWLIHEADSMQDKLLFLDCVDFKPSFCHIDTLSDVAMLAVDLEMHLTYRFDSLKQQQNSKKLVKHFLHAYLEATNESEAVWPLLEYYMAEKAMVCAYMCILSDKQPTIGEQYFDVALMHSRNLDKYLPLKIEKSIERSFALTTSAANPHG